MPNPRTRPEHRPPRALALLSGGLDSMLAARVVMDQGVEVHGLNFYTGFCVEGHTRALRPSKAGGAPKRHDALWVADQLGIRLHIADVAEDYKDVVLNPEYGYGSHFNPCLDCKIFMVTRAEAWARGRDFDFLITGEVLDQRPKSQRPEALPLIARASGTRDRLLRPLSAHHLPETLPEREGWVDRSRLYDFHGRNRKPQLALAAELGIEAFAPPAGGQVAAALPGGGNARQGVRQRMAVDHQDAFISVFDFGQVFLRHSLGFAVLCEGFDDDRDIGIVSF
jgi:tRNA U34 2-thiouridine synthase MnmA/TrmU